MLVCLKATKTGKTSNSIIILALILVPLYKITSPLTFLSPKTVLRAIFPEFIIFLSFYITFSAMFTKKKRIFIATS